MKRRFYTIFTNAWTRHSVVACVVVLMAGLAVTFQQQNVFTLLAAATSSLPSETTVVYFMPASTDPLSVGDTVDVDININALVPINVFGATISFPPDSLEVISISKAKSFLDLWTEETAIREDVGEVHFSGGTIRKGGLTGVATALTVTLRAKKAGLANLTFLNVDVLASNGNGDYVENGRRGISFEIREPLEVPSPTSTDTDYVSSTSLEFSNVSLLDMSIFTMRLFGPYSIKYDLNRDGILNLSDLSVFFGRIKNPVK